MHVTLRVQPGIGYLRSQLRTQLILDALNAVKFEHHLNAKRRQVSWMTIGLLLLASVIMISLAPQAAGRSSSPRRSSCQSSV